MPFFQNPFTEEFEGSWPVGDRHHMPTYVIKPNTGRGKEIIYSWNKSPYNLSGNDLDGNAKKYLNIIYCLHNPKNWATMQIDLTAGAVSSAAVTIEEVNAALLANSLFNERFYAEIGSYNDNTGKTIKIRSKKPSTEFKFYVQNGQAESVLKFNARAGIGELPTFLSRHTIANRFNYPDSEGKLIQLDMTVNEDAVLVNNAVDFRGVSLGYSSATVQADWQLLRGRAGIYQFVKGPSGNSVSTTETQIIYPAGAKAGDLAEKIIVQKDSGGAVVASFQIPYTLSSGDLITPP